MHLEAVNVTWLGGRVFADIIKTFQVRTSSIGWVLNPTSALGSEEQRREKGHVKAEAGVGVPQPQAKGHCGWPAPPQARGETWDPLSILISDSASRTVNE